VRFYRSDARKGKAFHDNRRMLARLSAFVIWSLVAASAVFWALRLGASPPQVPPYAVAVGNSVAVRGDLGRLFGVPQRTAAATQPTPEAPSRFRLIGVMAPRVGAMQAEPGSGVALIAVDGKPAKPYAVGARLDSDLVLQSVGLRTASLGPAQGARSVLLELPALPPPNSGVLPPVGMGAPATPAASSRTAPPAAPGVAGIAPSPQPPIQSLPPMAAPAMPPALPTQPMPPSENGRLSTQ
jgi:general secretion pathway protein C